LAYQWGTQYQETLKNQKVAELEKKVEQIVRKKIDDIDINSFEDFAYYLENLIKGLRELVETNFTNDDGELPDNLEFLLDELQNELEQ